MRVSWRIWAPIGLLVLLAFAAAAWFAGPPPPKSIRLATGQPGGAYAAAGERFAAALEKEGVRVELVPTAGSAENLSRLAATDDRAVDAAIIQGGLATPNAPANVMGLGALFLEPAWLFVRASGPGDDVQRLKGLRVAAGPEGSGARALFLTLLKDNAMAPEDLTILPLGGEAAAKALLAGEADAAFLVGGVRASWMKPLLGAAGISLVPFERAEAYSRLHPYLDHVTLAEGVIDPAANEPSVAVPLVAPAAQLAVRTTLHPAVQGLLLDAAKAEYSGGDALSDPGSFPNRHLVDIPLSEEARRYFDRGPTFLRRVLPYWAANLAERLVIFAIPALTLLVPLARAAPPVYRWRIRRRIYVWYRDLRALEEQGLAAKTEADRAATVAALDALLRDVVKVEVPLPYTDDLYRLQSHIRFVRSVITEAPLDETAMTA